MAATGVAPQTKRANRPFSMAPSTPLRPSLLSLKISPVRADPHPAGAGRTSILRTMFPNNRSVRWLPASISQ